MIGYYIGIWKCDECSKEHIYTSRQKHPSVFHNCKLKPVKQVEKKDFEHLHLVLSPNNNISNDDKRHQYEYWEKRINLRIKYLTPLINECNEKGYCLATLSKELHEEWLQLHEVKRFYKFK